MGISEVKATAPSPYSILTESGEVIRNIQTDKVAVLVAEPDGKKVLRLIEKEKYDNLKLALDMLLGDGSEKNGVN